MQVCATAVAEDWVWELDVRKVEVHVQVAPGLVELNLGEPGIVRYNDARMASVAVHVEVARVAALLARGQGHARDEASVVEVPQQVLLAKRKRVADDARRGGNRHRTEEDRTVLRVLRAFDGLLEARVLGDACEVLVGRNRISVAKAKVDRRV